MIGGAKKLHTNLLLDEHIEKILFIAWIVLVYSDEERRRTLRTAVFRFCFKRTVEDACPYIHKNIAAFIFLLRFKTNNI